jgi:hypothetical protein
LPENATGIGGGKGEGGGGGTCGGQLISFMVQLQRDGGGSNHKFVGSCVTQLPHPQRFRAKHALELDPGWMPVRMAIKIAWTYLRQKRVKQRIWSVC